MLPRRMILLPRRRPTASHTLGMEMMESMIAPKVATRVLTTTSKNVGDLNVDNAMPISFNHLSGNFTEALTSTPGGGADQTASWGGTPITPSGCFEYGQQWDLVEDVDDVDDGVLTFYHELRLPSFEWYG